MSRFRASAGVRYALLGLAMACAAVAIVDLITGGFALRAGVLRYPQRWLRQQANLVLVSAAT